MQESASNSIFLLLVFNRTLSLNRIISTRYMNYFNNHCLMTNFLDSFLGQIDFKH